MPAIRHQARLALVVAPLALALVATGCGEDGETSTEPEAAPAASMFPSAEGKTFEQLTADAEPSDLVVAPAQQTFTNGKNRYGFGVFTVEGQNVPSADVAIYAARPNGEAVGPFPAKSTTLTTDPAFASQTTTTDPDAATVVYTADVELDGEGEWRMMAMLRKEDGTFTTTNIPSAVVGTSSKIPDVGDEAPVVHTPTADDVGGDLTKIDTRQPPGTMHDVDYAEVVGKEPVVLLLATPALCTSRVCGPVVDITEEIKSERPDDAAYIHSEIYVDNDPAKGPNEQVRAFNLPSEPWLFVIDEDGKVSTRIEGAFSAAELNAAIDKAQ